MKPRPFVRVSCVLRHPQSLVTRRRLEAAQSQHGELNPIVMARFYNVYKHGTCRTRAVITAQTPFNQSILTRKMCLKQLIIWSKQESASLLGKSLLRLANS